MDTIKSFKGYGKVDEVEQQAFRRKTRKRLITIVVSSVVLLAIIISAVAGTVIHNRNGKNTQQVPSTEIASSLKALCAATLYPESCHNSISEAVKSSNSTISSPEQFFKLSLRVVLDSLEKLSTVPDEWMDKTKDAKVKEALKVCKTVFDDAVDKLNDSISSVDVNGAEKRFSGAMIGDLKTWLSTAITDEETCLDSLGELKTPILEDMKAQMKNTTEYTSNSLAIVAEVIDLLTNVKIPNNRKLLEIQTVDSGFPDWVNPGDRRLLQEASPTPDVVVAEDGSGDVKTIKEAVSKIPKKNTARFIIHVKAGRYLENVILDKSLWNVMMFGDGETKTIVSGSLNFVDGTPTFSTATFAAVGRGFIAKDMGFFNTAGSEKHQAVALRSGSDRSVFYRCAFNAFQDTLYAHSNRQFYRDCNITGTVDFIFGNAAVVLQNCNIQPRQPLPNQFVTITAQGKKDPNQNTGISIQKCSMTPLDNLTAKTYLGRPWKAYSTTVIMQSDIGAFLDPSGWISWVSNVDPPNTIFYGEYQNTGPGAVIDKRVKWDGYRPSITADDASKFTVDSFIQGTEWLSDVNVMYDKAL